MNYLNTTLRVMFSIDQRCVLRVYLILETIGNALFIGQERKRRKPDESIKRYHRTFQKKSQPNNKILRIVGIIIIVCWLIRPKQQWCTFLFSLGGQLFYLSSNCIYSNFVWHTKKESKLACVEIFACLLEQNKKTKHQQRRDPSQSAAQSRR